MSAIDEALPLIFNYFFDCTSLRYGLTRGLLVKRSLNNYSMIANVYLSKEHLPHF